MADLEVSPRALNRLDGFEQTGTREVLRVPYAVLRHPGGVELTLTAEGAAELDTPPSLEELKNFRENWLAGSVNRSLETLTSSLWLDAHARGKDQEGPYRGSFEDERRAALALHTMSWLRHRLSAIERGAKTVDVRVPTQYGKLTHLQTGQSERLADKPKGDTLNYQTSGVVTPLGIRELAHIRERTFRQIRFRLRSAVGRVGLELVNNFKAPTDDYLRNVMVSSGLFSFTSAGLKLREYDVTFWLTNQPNLETERDIHIASVALRALAIREGLTGR